MCRINLYGGPGSGKSTTAARVFSEMKDRKISVEHVSEYVKSWAYAKREVKEFDQVYIFAKQQQYEHRYLSHGVKNVITDSPTFLAVYYADRYISKEMSDAIWNLCDLYDKKYPVFNIFIDRGEKSYVSEGRYQTEEEAREMDNGIWEKLISLYPPEMCCRMNYLDKDAILAKVLEVCDK